MYPPLRAGLIGAALLAASCGYYSAPDEVVNSAVVFTQYSKTADFSSYTTFKVVSQIRILDPDDTGRTVPAALQQTILDRVAANLKARGYTQVPLADPATPDLFAEVTALFGSVDSYYPGGWCGYPGSCYWGYCGYSCWYDWVWVGSYEVGSLLVDLGDLKNAPVPPATGPARSVWANLDYGILYTTPSATRAADAIDQAFAQSPYLHK